jgi:heterodisulfide reductase subunit A-like polyferredoxin
VGDAMKIGVYVCECGVNIAATVNVEKVAEHAESLPNVAVSRFYRYMCSDPGQELIKKDIKELKLDRIVVASCSPRMHEPTFRAVLEEMGLNPYCLEMVNIREQCSWVHKDKKEATEKAKSLVESAVLRASLLKPLEKKSVGVTHSALVIGGGIAGIQAALDIGDMGFKTYLVEKTPSIGGRMAQLDKTFPTMDCSACILTPKMVDVGRHKNIELLTYSEVLDVDGYVGNFKVKVRKKPRYIDVEKCTGCGECVKDCPINVFDEFNMGQGDRKAIYIPFPQAVPQKYTIDKIGEPPCVHACPAGVNAQGYVALIREGKFQEALDLVRVNNPFPSVCGRICTHICEENCNRNEIDEPVAVRALKRFAADYERKHGRKKKEKKENEEEKELPGKGRKVAIIGAGPAGLTVAHDLALWGYKPTVFEALSKPGGMLRVGVPKYRLPEKILDYDIKRIEEDGVEIRTGTPIGPDLTLKDLINAGYEAIFLAIGTHKSKRLGVEGEDLDGVIHAAGFLHDMGIGRKVDFKDKIVAVIGGGNVAIDSVRTAVRLGAKSAFVIYRRSRSEIPAKKEELAECEKEGISFYYLAAPTRILGRKGKVAGIECQRMKLGEPDDTGRRRPMPIEGSTFSLDADIVISAIGQMSVLTSLAETQVQVEVDTKNGILPIATENLDLKGVYGFTAFLRALSTGKKIEIGKRIAVVGGGNVAMDVARSALRIGGEEIHVLCVESRDEMPAFKQEIKEAEEEGIILHTRRMPKRIIGTAGKAVGVETLKCTSVFDEDGRFNPQVAPNTEEILEADTIIVAIGQEVDYTLLKAADGILVTKGGLLVVDGITQQTNIPGVFAAGDAVSGPGLVIEAIAKGHEAAISIDRYLRGENLKKGRVKKEPIVAPLPEKDFEKLKRVEIPTLPVKERIHSFEEVELEMTEEMAVKEAERCLSCNICSLCRQCVDACEADAIDHDAEEEVVDLDVGAIVVATGFNLYDPAEKPEYGYGKFDNVITGLEFERIVSASGPTEGHIEINGKEPKKVVFIQCVGSRDKQSNEYCSRVCCMYTAKQAHMVRDKIPNAELIVYYTDVRAFGKGFEEFYNRVQGEDVTYRRRELADPIEVKKKGKKVVVKAKGHPDIDADLVVLATGIVPREDTKELARLLNINQSADGFLLEAHPKLRPVDTFTDGIFLAGCCQSPKDVPDTVAQASGAASRACDILSKKQLMIEATVANVNEDLCRGCGFCVEACPYKAIELKEIDRFGNKVIVATVNEALCKGCGSCSAACLNGAISHLGFTDGQILTMIKALGK